MVDRRGRVLHTSDVPDLLRAFKHRDPAPAGFCPVSRSSRSNAAQTAAMLRAHRGTNAVDATRTKRRGTGEPCPLSCPCRLGSVTFKIRTPIVTDYSRVHDAIKAG
jgi:hypothetical protein